jgi:hypothetical protein
MIMTYTIHSVLLERFENKLKSFQRKFAKYGDGKLVYSVSEPYIYEFDEEQEGSIKDFDGREVIDITVEGEYKINEYEFVAALQFDNESGRNIVNGGNIPEEFLTRCACDHCKTSRARSRTVVLRKGDEYIQVGNSCVKDYLGVNIERYASYLSFWRDLEDMEEDNKIMIVSARPAFSVEDVLLETAWRVAKSGYVSKEKAWEWEVDATSSAVWNALHSHMNHEYTDEHSAAVAAVVEFVNNQEEDFGYVSNLKSLINNKYVTNKNFGLLVSAFGYYAAEMRKVEREKAEQVTANSKWVGKVGDKLKFVARPVLIYSMETQWGYSYLYRFVQDGNELIWKTGTWLDTDIEYEVSGTIKAHNEYRGKKQTELTRCRVKEMARKFEEKKADTTVPETPEWWNMI